ncbi:MULTISPECIES: hypothetical protein [unclassified Kitasatospora]|uniref:hypothetical protein n=1 Tax=unclassified Kitasatospora TaxID=2633591 RepID=UPI00070DDF51|nr:MULTISPECIES: hypothetical protein [unclassified Kitasatospora]KQV18332.1 hypothetical protein ASC99_03585 [Kitasatospora sp. Root107]KRB74317.1 hypothetical protein ASE03_17495 [Kitasatospora sp. Root187]
MNSRQDDLKRDLDAALQTRKELGQEYETEIVDSFLTRLDARIDAQVDQRVEDRLAQHGVGDGPRGGRSWTASGRLPLISLGLAIPLTAISAGEHLPGMLVCWAGIVGVNFAAALAGRGERRSRSRSDWH